MNIQFIVGFAVITKTPVESAKLYKSDLGLPLDGEDEYLSMDHFPGLKHFGVWPLKMAAESCFGKSEWPSNISEPTSTIEYELENPEAVSNAVKELRNKGYIFIHDAREEPWGQTVARFLSPENVLIGLSFAPWFHK